MIQVKRVYSEPNAQDGSRILVDRVWPRGISKDRAHIVEWRKELAPSTALRKWFGHDPKRWEEFQRRYRAELRRPEQQGRLDELITIARRGPVTLLYSARDEEHNQALALRSVLEDSLKK